MREIKSSVFECGREIDPKEKGMGCGNFLRTLKENVGGGKGNCFALIDLLKIDVRVCV